MLVCPLFGVVEPGVGEPVRQMAFSLFDVVDEAAEVGAALRTGGYGAGSAKGHLLTTLALDGDASRIGTRRPCRTGLRGSRSALRRARESCVP